MATQRLWSFGQTVNYQNNKSSARAIIASPLRGARPTRGGGKVRGQTSGRAPGSRR